jgi:hypothetical protein
MSIIMGVAMEYEQVEPFASRDGLEDAGEGASRWMPGVKELLDHLAQELALEYIRLMEQEAEAVDATPDEPHREEE